jgi:hypothetical protein
VISSLAIDAEGNIWAGTYRGSVSVLRTDGSWRTYDNSNPGINDIVHGLAFDPQGNLWVGRWFSGVSVLFRDPEKVVSDSPQWVALNRYRSSYSFTTLVPRGTYSLSVSGARGTDGIEIPPYAGVTFTVDYAGYIADTTPPPPPTVTASVSGTTTISGRWSANDPQSAITLYRYTIGTTPGGTDVVNWTNVGVTEVVRSELNLLAGQTYYVSVKARNEGGLWSEPGVSNGVVAGVAPPCYDFNHSGQVDVADIMQVASHWRCKCEDTCYNSLYDIDNDCDIDIVDIMLVVKHWGESCP